MKWMNRLIKCFLIPALIIQFSFVASAQDTSNSLVSELTYDQSVLALNETNSPDYSEELRHNLEESQIAYSNLILSFYSSLPEEEKHPQGLYSVNGIPAGGFPSCFAGAYINCNLDLVILLTENSAKTKDSLIASQHLISSAAASNSLIFSTAEFSYSELVATMNDIYQFERSRLTNQSVAELSSYPTFSIQYYAIDDFNNRILVALDDISPEAIASFRTLVSDSSAIEFVLAHAYAEDDTIVNPGGAIDNGSVGYKIYKQVGNTYKEGFVTAGHCYQTNDEVYIGNTVVADAGVRQNSNNVDAVFCALRSGHSVGTTIAFIGGTLQSGIDMNLAQGNPITMIGKITQGEDGTVLSVSYAYTDSQTGIQYADLMSSNYNRSNGDSGGLVISTRTGYNYVAGIHKGYVKPNIFTRYSVFSKACNINYELGLTFYEGY